MLRKIIFACSITALSSTSVWANCGVYAGIGFGPDYAKFQQNANVRQIQNSILNFNVRNNAETAGTGVFGTIFAGYGYQFHGFQQPIVNQLYLAGELNANLSSLEHEEANKEFVHLSFAHTKFKMQSSYGISVLPGFVYTDQTLFYGRLGYSNTNFKVKTTDVSLANTNTNLGGFRWGFGIQQMVATQLAVRMDYSHVNYDRKKLSSLDALSNTTKVTHVTPQTNEVEFSLIYKMA